MYEESVLEGYASWLGAARHISVEISLQVDRLDQLTGQRLAAFAMVHAPAAEGERGDRRGGCLLDFQAEDRTVS